MANPFPKSWWSFDLGKYRPCESTYQRYDYETIPPLDEKLFDGTYSWLEKKGKKSAKDAKRVEHVNRALKEVGLELPKAATLFLSDSGLQGQISSCTACEWDLGEAPRKSKVGENAYTVRFLRDQQDCLLWYLFLAPGESSVIVSPIPFDDPGVDEEVDVVTANTWWCAPHFEHFIYRFWIENEIWDRVNGRNPQLEGAMKKYAEHYFSKN